MVFAAKSVSLNDMMTFGDNQNALEALNSNDLAPHADRPDMWELQQKLVQEQHEQQPEKTTVKLATDWRNQPFDVSSGRKPSESIPFPNLALSQHTCDHHQEPEK
jgi:hypothetical protein